MSTDTSQPTPDSYQSLTARTRRAINESMTITACSPGAYLVESASGATYAVDLAPHPDTNRAQTTHCTCPDYTDREPAGGCKHLRRVKLDVAFGELRHPNDWPTDDDLAEREPSRPDDQQETAPVPLAADGGQVPPLSGSDDTSSAASTDRHSNPNSLPDASPISDEAPLDTDLDTSRDMCYRISERIQGLNHEIDRRRGELRDLKTALSVFEELTGTSEPPTGLPGQ
ncbi:hypothetical protein [Halococcus thailandensis]|uniref:hypothetical protein n=1 Tax=Halococcus thailandensis TaxID=335952 RepID=UPI0012691F84|nr:hypothetical protein [Halococcus thailandensis]